MLLSSLACQACPVKPPLAEALLGRTERLGNALPQLHGSSGPCPRPLDVDPGRPLGPRPSPVNKLPLMRTPRAARNTTSLLGRWNRRRTTQRLDKTLASILSHETHAGACSPPKQRHSPRRRSAKEEEKPTTGPRTYSPYENPKHASHESGVESAARSGQSLSGATVRWPCPGAEW